ncbi:DUF669 domain-containing protein [Paenochrobactrum pullorum]|uniref:DUF669 domain-containing protein n=1 Tax=Paenochrobactrum pullorum TaxID=1324351 RepID=UPI0035BC7672
MAQLGQRFNAQDHDTTQSDYSELPNGDYELEIEASDINVGANGTGLKTTMNVVRPEEYKGRKLFNYYNLEHKNAQAQEIGQRQFASLCRAIGVSGVDDSEELHFKLFTVKVGIGKPSKDGQYPARAEIKKYYFPDEGNVPTPAVDANQPRVATNDNRPAAANDNRPAQAATGTTGRRPWK